jgi:hypothetical protein
MNIEHKKKFLCSFKDFSSSLKISIVFLHLLRNIPHGGIGHVQHKSFLRKKKKPYQKMVLNKGYKIGVMNKQHTIRNKMKELYRRQYKL